MVPGTQSSHRDGDGPGLCFPRSFPASHLSLFRKPPGHFSVLCRAGGAGNAPEILAAKGLGHLLSGTLFLALTLFLTVFVPARVFGIFLGPRTGRYFDQIVITGIKPWRFFAGKYIEQQSFFGILLLVCLPYLFFCISLGGVSPVEVLICLAMLFVYVQVLVTVSLVASLHFSELVSFPLVVGGFTASAFLGLLPISPLPLHFTPTSPIMGAFYQDWAASVTRTPFGGLFRGGFESLTLAQSHLLLFFILSGCLLALGTLAISLGPVHSLAPRLNTFGEAILPGDAKRSTWLKRRLNLRRNAELCFLYENHSPAW